MPPENTARPEIVIDPTKPLERSYPIRAAADTKTMAFTGIAVPWDEEIDLYGDGSWVESFARGAVQDSDGAKVFYQHREIIGHITGNSDAPGGWEIDGFIADTTQGRDGYALLKAGSITQLSVRFLPQEWERTESGAIRFTKVKVTEVSLVAFPAYENAEISAVRSAPTIPAPKEGNTVEEDNQTSTGGPAADVAELRESVQDLERRVTIGLKDATPAPAPVGAQWRSHGHYLHALANGDAEAAEFHRAYQGVSTDDTVAKAAWIGSAVKLAEERRKVMNSFTVDSLPKQGMSVEFAKLETNSITVGKQEKQGDDLKFGKVKIGVENAPVETYGGYTTLSLQAINRATVNILDTSLQALLLAYLRATELAVRAELKEAIDTQLAAGADNFLTLPASAKAADWVDMIVDASELYDERGYNLTGLYVAKDIFKKLYRLEDTAGNNLMQVYGDGVNQLGQIDAKGLEGKLTNLPVKLLPGAAAGTATFYDPLAIKTLEDPSAPVKLQDSNIVNLSNDYSIYGDLATATEHPGAIVPLKIGAGTGGASVPEVPAGS